MANNRIPIHVDFLGNIGNLKKSIDGIQTQLGKLGLPKGSFKVDGIFSKLKTEIEKVESLTSSGTLGLGDVKTFENSIKKISTLYSQLQLKIKSTGELSKKEFEKFLPADVINKLESARGAFDRFEREQKDTVKQTRELSKELKQQKKTYEELQKQMAIKPLSRNEREKKTRDRADKNDALTEAKKQLTEIQSQIDAKIKEYNDTGHKSGLTKSGGLSRRSKADKALLDEYKQADTLVKTLTTDIEQLNTELESKVTLSDYDKVKKEFEEIDAKVRTTEGALESLKQEAQNDTAFKTLVATLTKLGVPLEDIKNDEEGLIKIKQAIENIPSEKIEHIARGFENLDRETKDLRGSMDGLESEMRQTGAAASEMQSRMNEVQGLKQQVMYFFQLTNAVQLARQALTNTINTIKELDSTMTETAVVTDFTISDMWDQLPENTKRAQELGVAINDVYKAQTLYYQQGLKTNQVMSLTNETLKLAKISGLDAAEATDRMTNALRGFNMEINQANAQRINDVYSRLAAVSAADTEEISNAMTKTASIAANAGASYENTAAFLTQIIETTRESSETAGTALKTIIARFNEMKVNPNEVSEVEGEVVDFNKIDGALRSVGISLKDANGQIRNFDDVILELSRKWDTLDKNTRSYIATTAAGSRQQSRFIALMSNNARLTELVGEANDSAGASQKQFEKTLESLETKLQNLNSAWQSFLLGIVDNDLIKGGIDFLTWILTAVNDVTSALGPLGQTLSRILVIVGAFNAARGIFNGVFNGLEKFTNLGSSAGVKNGLISGATAAAPAVAKIVEESVEAGARKGMIEGKMGGGGTGSPGTPLDGKKQNWFTKKHNENQQFLNNKKLATGKSLDKNIYHQEYQKLYKQKRAAGFSQQDIRNNYKYIGKQARVNTLAIQKDKYGAEVLKQQQEGKAAGKAAGGQAGMMLGAMAGSWAGSQVVDWLGGSNRVSKTLDLTTKSVDSFSAALEETQTALDALSETEKRFKELGRTLQIAAKGSDEYKTALKENNKIIRDAINENRDLAQYADYENGQWKIKSGQKENFWAAQELALKDKEDTLEMQKLTSEMQTSELEYDKNRQNSGIKTDEWTDEEKERDKTIASVVGGVGGAAAGLATGAAVGAAVGTVVPVIGNIIGGIVGGLAGLVAGGLAGGVTGGATVGLLRAIDQFNISQDKFDATVDKFGDEGWVLDDATIDRLKDGTGLTGEELEMKKYLEGQGILDNFLDAIKGNTDAFMELVNSSELTEQQQIEYATELAKAKGLLKTGSTLEDYNYNKVLTESFVKYSSGEVDSLFEKLSTEEQNKYYSDVLKQLGGKKDGDKYLDAQGLDITEQVENAAKSAYATDLNNKQLEKLARVVEKGAAPGRTTTQMYSYKDEHMYDTSKNYTYSTKGWNTEDLLISDSTRLYGYSDISGTRYTYALPNSKNPDAGLYSYDTYGEYFRDGTQASYVAALGASMGYEFLDKFVEDFGKEGLTGQELVDAIVKNVSEYVKNYKEIKANEVAESEIYKQTGNVYAAAKGLEFDEKMGEGAAEDLFKGQSDETKKKIGEILANADFTTREGLDIFVRELDKIGVDVGISGENLAEKINNLADKFGVAFVSIDQKTKALDAQRLVQQKAYSSDRTNFTDAEYQSIISALPGMASSFVQLDDGTWEYADAFTSLEDAVRENTDAILGRTTTEEQAIKNAEIAGRSTFDWQSASTDNYGAQGEAIADYLKRYMTEYGVDLETAARQSGLGDLYDAGGIWGSEDGAQVGAWNSDGTLNANLASLLLAASKQFANDITNKTANEEKVEQYTKDEYIKSSSLNPTNAILSYVEGTEGMPDLNTHLQLITKLGAEYEISSEIIGEYNKAMRSGTEEEKKNAKAKMATAVQIAKTQKKYENLIDTLDEHVDKIDESLKGTTQYNKSLKAIAGAASEAFGFNLDESFVEKHRELFKQLNSGDPEKAAAAYKEIGIQARLASSFMQDLITKIGLTGEQARLVAEAEYNIHMTGTADLSALYVSLIAAGKTAQEALGIIHQLASTSITFQASGMELREVFNHPDVIQAYSEEGYIPIGANGDWFTMYKPGKITAAGSAPNFNYKGGGGSGGGGGSDSKYEPDYDKYYNHLEKINSILRKREKLEKKYQQLVNKNQQTVWHTLKNHQDRLALLKQEKAAQEEMVKLRNAEMRKELAENSKLSKYATYDFNSGTVKINREAIYSISNSEKGEEIDEYISKLEEIRDAIQGAEDAVLDLEDEIIEENNRFKENYLSFEERIYDAVIHTREKEIEELENINTSITDASSKLLEGIQQKLDEERQARQNQETEEDISDTEKRLAYLRQDTSGANAAQIKQLEEELADKQEDYTDTLIDQKISELQEQNDDAAEQREKQIKLLQDVLEHDKETGEIWDKVYSLMDTGFGNNGIKLGSELDKYLKAAEEYMGMSEAQRQRWRDEVDAEAIDAKIQWDNKGQRARNRFAKTGYDKNDDLSALMEDAKKRGDFAELKKLENVRNLKIDAYNRSEKKTYAYQNSDYGTIMQNTDRTKYPELYYNLWAERMAAINYNAQHKWALQDNVDYLWLAQQAAKRENKTLTGLALRLRERKLGGKMDYAALMEKTKDKFLWNVLYEMREMKLGHIPKTYKTGGLADYTGPAWLDGTKSKPELVLNATDTQNFMTLTELLRDSNFSNAIDQKTGDTYIDINVNVEEIGSDYDVDRLIERVKQNIQTDAQWRNVNVLGRK